MRFCPQVKRAGLLAGVVLGMAALRAAAFELTPAEQAWLAEHPVIRVGVPAASPPINFQDQNGVPSGIGAEVLAAMNTRLGGALELHPGPWSVLAKHLKQGQLDAVMDVPPEGAFGELLHFTQPYLTIPHVIVAKEGGRYYRTPRMLLGGTLALERDSPEVAWFKEKHPKVRLRLYATTSDALDGVARGETVATAGNRAVVTCLLEQEMLTNLRMHGRLRDYPDGLTVGVRQDWPSAVALLDRALNDVLHTQGPAILEKWFAQTSRAGGRLELSPTAQAWLAAHPEIRIGVAKDWPPMSFTNEAGQLQGIAVDVVALLNERLDGRLSLVAEARNRLVATSQAGHLAAIMDADGLADGAALLYSKPYASIPQVLVGRRGGDYFDSLESLSNRTLAVESASAIAALVRASRQPIQVVEFPTLSAALAAVAAGQADAYAGSRAAAAWQMARDLLGELQIQGTIRDAAPVGRVGVTAKLPELKDILNATLAALAPESVQDIFEKWSGPNWEPSNEFSWIKLTPQEKQWLAEHPVIRVGSNPRWAPLEFNDAHGLPKGITHELLERFSRALDIKFEYVAIPSWRQAQAKLRDEEMELLSGANKASARKADFQFTPPYLSLPTAIFTQEKTPYVSHLAELKNKKVAVVIGYALENYLRTQCPDAELIAVRNVQVGLKMVAAGEAFAFAGPLLITSHYIQRGGHTRIKVGGDLDFIYQPAFVTRAELKPLVQILSRALESLDDQERNAMTRKWLSVTYQQSIDYTKLYKYVAGAAGLMILFLLWNRQMAREIRRRQIVEASLLKSEEALTAANKELEAFSYSVSHDLRAPLRHIGGFVQLLQAGSKDKLDDTGARYLDVIAAAAQKMGHLIDDLLSFSRTGRAQMHMEAVPLGPLVEECRRELEPEMSGRQIQWQIGELPTVEADRPLLRQVFANLLGNAVKYTGKRDVAHIAVLAETQDHQIVLSVRDNGAGFDMTYVDKLFGVFQRLHTEQEFEGTGIGLANVRRIVARHGGRTWAEGSPDQGATFYFSLPKPAAPDSEEET